MHLYFNIAIKTITVLQKKKKKKSGKRPFNVTQNPQAIEKLINLTT